LCSLNYCTEFNLYLIAIDIFDKCEFELENSSGVDKETKANSIFYINEIFKKNLIDVYQLFQPFLIKGSTLMDKVVSLLCEHTYFKELQVPSCRLLLTICMRIRNRLTKDSPQTVILKY
jgi:hypothetical protein